MLNMKMITAAVLDARAKAKAKKHFDAMLKEVLAEEGIDPNDRAAPCDDATW